LPQKLGFSATMQTLRRSELLPWLAKPDPAGFAAAEKATFAYQIAHNPLYAKYIDLLARPRHYPTGGALPAFLPISFFKSHAVQAAEWLPEVTFSSSGTTGQTPSQHRVRDLAFYLENARRGFSHFYGDPSEWVVLALLPSYLERGGSSLVAMADYFIRLSQHPESGFFLHDFERLKNVLKNCQSKGYKILLLGVSFALLDFSEQHPLDLSGVTLMETGGMKGRRRELTRAELHDALRAAFGAAAIHSEYGMTELLSQAYAQGGSRFWPAPTMRVVATEINDPFCAVAAGKTGVLNIVDLANLDSCSFVQTEDLGRVFPDGSFEVLGRLDAAELRGCNLLLEI
jgi:hypothetical protein